jgi:hypothetical protein
MVIMQFRKRTPYTDNPKTETEVAEDDLHIFSNSKDQVLPGQCDLKVDEEKIDELTQEIQPEILRFTEASIHHSPFGRTDVCSNQGNTEESRINYFNTSRSTMMIPQD